MIHVLAAVVGTLACWRGLRASGWLLLVRACADATGALLVPLRATWPRPYIGTHLVIWLVTDVALFTLPPAAVVFLIGQRAGAVVAWIASVACVGIRYPALRGDSLLTYYAALYIAAYAIGMFTLLARADRRGRATTDEQATLVVLGCGLASVILVQMYGVGNWWAVWITNGAAYASVLWLAITRPRSRGSDPPVPPDVDGP
jgi:hypothetical protein